MHRGSPLKALHGGGSSCAFTALRQPRCPSTLTSHRGTSKPEVAEARMISRSRTAAVPGKFAVAFSDRKVVDAGVTLLHQRRRVVEPILVAVGTEPLAAVVMPLVSETDG